MATLSQPSHFQYNFDIPSPTHHTAMDQHSPNDESRRPSHPSEQSSQDEYSLSGSLPTDWLDYLDATTNSTLNTAPNVSVTVSQPLYTGTGTGTGTHGVIYGFDPLYLPNPDLAFNDLNAIQYSYTSPNSTASEPSIPSQAHDTAPVAEGSSHSAPAPRRRENRYRNAPPGVLSRRRAQNRASQRAYRERKEQRIRELEQLLADANQREEALTQAYLGLQTEYERLHAEHITSSSGSTPHRSEPPSTPGDRGASEAQQSHGMIDSVNPEQPIYNYQDPNDQV